MFEKAARLKIRFNTPLGSLPVEDVWDLPLLPRHGRGQRVCLDELAKTLNRELKTSDTESFVLKQTEPNEELILKFEIVKHIISVRLQEQETADNAKKAKEKKAMIMALISEKETETLKGKSLEDLRSLLESL
jgi:hypothetical protein